VSEEAPRNLEELQGEFFDLAEITIAEWHPERDGRGRPTQVHLLLKLVGRPDSTFVMRFRGPDTLALIINALTEHGTNVFGRDLEKQLRRLQRKGRA
jgi:hypothetical protein